MSEVSSGDQSKLAAICCCCILISIRCLDHSSPSSLDISLTVFILYLDDIYNLSPDIRCLCLMKLKIWTHQHQGNWAESSLSALAFHSCPGNKETPSIIIRRLSHIFKLPENAFNHETPKKASFKDSYQRQLNTVHALICCNSFPFTCRLLICSGKIY